MNLKRHIADRLFTVLILGFLGIGFFLNLGVQTLPWQRFYGKTTDFADWSDEVHDAYVENIAHKSCFINLGGFFAKCSGRTVYNGVSTLKNGMLDYDSLAKVNTSALAACLMECAETLAEQGIPFLYLQAPLKTDLKDTLLPYGIENYGNQNATALLSALERAQIHTLDLRKRISATSESVERYFYRTDHHWNTHGAFVAFGETVRALQAMLPNQTFDLSLTDASNWKQDVYRNWFLGSRGKRVGKYFGGTDDLVIYTPKFESNMTLSIPLHNTSYSGSFEDTLIRSEYLDTPDYFGENPYYAYIGGDYPLVHHQNALAPNNLRVLLIKDSFSIPLQAFLSTSVRELDVLDPRYYTEGRVADYISKSHPDIVLLMLNPSMFSHPSYQKLS